MGVKGTVTFSEFHKFTHHNSYALRTDQTSILDGELPSVQLTISTANAQTQNFHPTPPLSPTCSNAVVNNNKDNNNTNNSEGVLNFPEHLTTDPTIEELVQEMESHPNSTFKNTYFFDDRSRFISVPSLGNSSTKSASQVSRVFEEWLESKIYFHSSPDTVPILEESVSSSAHDIMQKFHSRANRVFNGLSSVLIKIRAGHIYTYHDNESADMDLCVEDDIAEFFQKFPLFVEVSIITKPSEGLSSNTQVILSIENAGVNPARPFMLREVFLAPEEGRSCGSGRSPRFSPMSPPS